MGVRLVGMTETHAQTKLTGDFDFLVGTWDVEHKRLLEPLTGSDKWDTETNSTTSAWTYLDGSISIDEIALPDRGWTGMSLRVYSPETGQWSIWWVNSRDGKLAPPVHGGWADGSCRLIGDDQHEGTPVRVTYEWSDISETTAQWKQDYSADGEQSWETNWVMRFSRTADQPTEPPTDHLDKLTGDFDFLAGSWKVRNRKLKERLKGSDEWLEFEHTQVGRTHLNGMVSIDANHSDGGWSGFTIRIYDVAAREWAVYWIDGRTGRLDPIPARGGFTDGVGELFSDEEWEGTPIRCRFRWSGITADSARWEQAFSTDGGQTWETNWISEFSRVS